MRKKILFISSWYPSKVEPTNGNFVQRHAEAVALKNDVEVLHAVGCAMQKKQYEIEKTEVNGIITIIVYYKTTALPILNFVRRWRAYQKGWRALSCPDLVHANILKNSMLFAVWLKWWYHIPFVISEHWSIFLKENRSKLSKGGWCIAQFIARYASYILPVSNAMKNHLKELGFQNRFKVVGNVVDTQLFSVGNTKSGPFTFLHISNLVPLKNADKIIKVAARLRAIHQDFRLCIGGDGDVEVLKTLVAQLDATAYIEVFDALTLAEVADKMKSSHCFILFSNYENLPCVLLESIATGTPVIATRVGGVSEIVNERNGVLISINEEELLAVMKKMLEREYAFSSPEALHKEIEEKCSRRVISEVLDEVYQKVLGQ